MNQKNLSRKLLLETTLRSVGAPNGKSFRDTVAAVLLAAKDEDNLDHMMELYATTAKFRHNKPPNITRNIQYLIDICWTRCPEGVNSLMGYESDKKPSPAAFISALSSFLIRRENEEKSKTLVRK